MVYAAVGIKCPECAGQPTGARAATQRVGRAATLGTGALVTKTLIGINVLVYLISIAQGAGDSARRTNSSGTGRSSASRSPTASGTA